MLKFIKRIFVREGGPEKLAALVAKAEAKYEEAAEKAAALAAEYADKAEDLKVVYEAEREDALRKAKVLWEVFKALNDYDAG